MKIKIRDFEDYHEYMSADRRYASQFGYLDASCIPLPANEACRGRNWNKNRYEDILPYDHSRVKLQPLPGDDPSDYINANFVQGFNREREYIACQGPTSETLGDFWRMVWDHKCQIIIMLTQLMEKGLVKCAQYWPDPGRQGMFFGLAINTISEKRFTAHTERKFLLQKKNEVREATQLHFAEWPDQSVPKNPTLLVDFIILVQESFPLNIYPIIVHCSAGVGRTGTYIAVDILRQHMKIYDYVDVYRLIEKLRFFRYKMVQTLVQYIFVHECVRYIIQNMFQEDIMERQQLGDNSRDVEPAEEENMPVYKLCRCKCCGVPWFR